MMTDPEVNIYTGKETLETTPDPEVNIYTGVGFRQGNLGDDDRP